MILSRQIQIVYEHNAANSSVREFDGAAIYSCAN